MRSSIKNTAFGVAKTRCVEMFYSPEQRLFDDPYSIQLLPPVTRMLTSMMRWKWIRELFLWMSEWVAPGLTGGIVCRTRYIDDVLQHCVEAGITTIINLGAGLDTRGLRLPGLSHVTYYEVDHADVLNYKQAKIVAFQGSVPHHLRFIPVNFQHESVEDRLQAEGWQYTDRTLFIVEGVIQYITPGAFHALLKLVSHAAEESHVVFTYPKQDFLDGTKDYGTIHRLLTYARYLGISSYNGFLPDTLPLVLEPYSLEVLHDVDAEDYQQSFLHALNRNLDVWGIERVAWACLCRVSKNDEEKA